MKCVLVMALMLLGACQSPASRLLRKEGHPPKDSAGWVLVGESN